MDWCTYNCAILSITFSEALAGTESRAGGQRQTHSRSAARQNNLLGESTVFWVWKLDYGWHIKCAQTQPTDQGKYHCFSTVLHAGWLRRAFSAELMGNHAVQCVKGSLHRGSFKSKMPILSKLQTVITNPISHNICFSFKEQTLYVLNKKH